MHWPWRQKVNGQGHVVTVTVTDARLLQIGDPLLRSCDAAADVWGCTSCDCHRFIVKRCGDVVNKLQHVCGVQHHRPSCIVRPTYRRAVRIQSRRQPGVVTCLMATGSTSRTRNAIYRRCSDRGLQSATICDEWLRTFTAAEWLIGLVSYVISVSGENSKLSTGVNTQVSYISLR